MTDGVLPPSKYNPDGAYKSVAISTTVYQPYKGLPSLRTGRKIFTAFMRTGFPRDQSTLVKLFSPFILPGDLVMTHPHATHIDYAFQIPNGIKGSEFFDLVEFIDNAPKIKKKGAGFISYDLEPVLSPPDQVKDPIVSIQKAKQIALENELKFIAAPAHLLGDTYYEKIAPLADLYLLMSQNFANNKYFRNPVIAYHNYVAAATAKLRNTHLEMPIIAEFDNQQTELSIMKECWTSIADIVDGITVWYPDDAKALTELEQFLSWFRTQGW